MTEPSPIKPQGPPRTRGMRQIRADGSRFDRHILLPAERFIYNETISGSVLLVCAIIAMIWANSPWSDSYFALRDLPLSLSLGSFSLALDLQHWVNDGAMAIFFFVVSMEIKRELIYGELSEIRKAVLPVAAALGGMIFPAGIYLILNHGGKGEAGWGIPMATDIAFATAILALLGRNVPSGLRLFLLTFAIADDIGSILVIAIYYTAHLSHLAMEAAGAALVLILAIRWLGLRSALVYSILAASFWLAMHESGIHATVAGVILGFIVPAKSMSTRRSFVESMQGVLPNVRDSLDNKESARADVFLGRIEELARQTESPLRRMERMVQPWVTYLVLPVFALMNAGVALSSEFIRQAFASPVTLGVIFGLIIGKTLGVTGFSWIAVRLGWGALPAGVTWRHILGAGMIGGVGFTVALFITGLAFSGKTLAEEAKVGVITASFIAALLGYLYLRLFGRKRRHAEPLE